MEKTQVRLELLKLVYSHHGTDEAVGRARALERYLYEEPAQPETAPAAPAKEAKGKGKGKAGNSDLFD